MNEHEALTDRLHELSRSAAVTTVDPLDDVRRGQAALRRRRLRAGGGVATAVVAVGALAVTVHGSGPAGGDGGPSRLAEVAASSVPDLCLRSENPTTVPEEATSAPLTPDSDEPAWEHPSVASRLADYRRTAVAVLDPSGAHLAPSVTNVQFGCDAAGSRLAHLGTTLAWNDAGAVAMVRVQVFSADHDEDEIVAVQEADGRWTTIEGDLPAGVVSAQVNDHARGHAVLAQRQDGTTVVVDTAEVWGNNAAPGSPGVRDLPVTQELLELAASDQLTLPGRIRR